MTQSSSDRLRQLKKLRGIRDAPELAALTGINVSTVRSNLNGSRLVSKKTAPIYCARLRAPVDWLLYGTGPGPDAKPPAPANSDLSVAVGGVKPTFVVVSSIARVSPDGRSKGVELTGSKGESIVLATDPQAREQLRRTLDELETISGALAE